MSRLDALDQKQLAAFEAVKRELGDAPHAERGTDSWFQLSDKVILDYCVARNFDAKKASKMLQATIEFRNKWRPHEILPTDPDIASKTGLGHWRVEGAARNGCPVNVVDFSKFGPSDFENDSVYTRFIIYEMETIKKMCYKAGVERNVTIYDLTGFSILSHGSPRGMYQSRLVVDIMQNHYPEFLHKMFLFNAPTLFKGVWAVAKLWIDPVTSAKIVFVKQPSDLLAEIDEAVLHVRFGGKRAAPYPSMT